MRRQWMIGAPMLVLILAGCPRLGICVEAIDTSVKSFSFNLGAGTSCDDTPEVTGVTIRRLNGDSGVVWHITSAEGTPVSQIQYGELPEGFSQGLVAKPLNPGDRLDISVDARNGMSGGTTVTISEGASRSLGRAGARKD
ncbi:MAG: hypothetical protein ACH37Z_04315 [Anaerolineae bacterium]